ncbi:MULTISPECIES: hypothetical protein [Nocardia]|uniref:hypothetical protein n=1 Tax=Nocardia TaxID=1817 RepID=UPI001895D477|nr:MULTISPECIES: hypothetical protein [Nocardia]MBF6352249.1 hypothetical protein [Nocardia flavorosea]
MACPLGPEAILRPNPQSSTITRQQLGRGAEFVTVEANYSLEFTREGRKVHRIGDEVYGRMEQWWTDNGYQVIQYHIEPFGLLRVVDLDTGFTVELRAGNPDKMQITAKRWSVRRTGVIPPPRTPRFDVTKCHSWKHPGR